MRKSVLALYLIALIGLFPFAALAAVNVNRANAQAIAAELDGVGPAKAAAIVSYRKAHGPFKSIDDLGHVKGIGPKTLELNRGNIVLK